MTAKQLTDSILQLAIQGKLVPQDPNDEPASVLLERIREEKRRLVEEKVLKKKDLEEMPIDEDEIPYAIPEGWTWCRVSDISESFIGLTYKPSDVSSEGWIVLRSSNIQNGQLCYDDIVRVNVDVSEKLRIRENDIIICARNGSKKLVGKSALVKSVDSPMTFGAFMAICRTPFYSYMAKYLLSPLFFGQLRKESDTTTINQLTQKNFNKYLVPLPPLAEQHRIVERIEEILPFVKEYGEAYEEASKMDAELPDKLKKSILQEAIMGKLGTQDDNDEPASVLLEQIREEKKKLVKEGILKKKDLEETPVDEEEEPFKVPDNWSFVRLGEITYNHGQKTPTEDFSYIDIGSIDNKRQKLNDSDNIIKAKDAPSRARKIVKLGDILYATVRPYLHNMCIVDRVFNKEPIASTGFAVMTCVPGLYNKYLFYYLLSPIFDEYANDGDNAKGMAYPAINDKKLYNGVVPLPPLAEQHRIVQRIEELYSEIDNMTINKNNNETEIEETEG